MKKSCEAIRKIVIEILVACLSSALLLGAVSFIGSFINFVEVLLNILVVVIIVIAVIVVIKRNSTRNFIPLIIFIVLLIGANEFLKKKAPWCGQSRIQFYAQTTKPIHDLPSGANGQVLSLPGADLVIEASPVRDGILGKKYACEWETQGDGKIVDGKYDCRLEYRFGIDNFEDKLIVTMNQQNCKIGTINSLTIWPVSDKENLP